MCVDCVVFVMKKVGWKWKVMLVVLSGEGMDVLI